MNIKNKKKISIIIAVGIVLVSIGTVGALNGWFGGGSSIPSDTMTRGLVGYWSFDEGNGTTTYDASGNNNDGYFATVASSPKWTTGKVSGALSFDGVDDYIDTSASDTFNFGSGSFSIETWMKTSVTPTAENFMISKDRWRIGLSVTQVATQFQIYDGTNNPGATYAFSSYSTVDNNWHYIVGVRDTGTAKLKLYIDGVERNVADDTAGSIDSEASLLIGKSSAGEFFNGLLDEVRIYNRALSADEIRYHYNRGGPVGHWTFDEGNGTTTYDSTDNGNDGYFASTTTSPTWTTGKYGTALSFDGVDDYADYGNLWIGQQWSEITVGAWIYPYEIKTTAIFETYYSSAGFTFSLASNKINASVGDSTDAVNVVDTADASTNQWYHIILTFSTKDHLIKMYVNGVEKNTAINTSVDYVTYEYKFIIGGENTSPSNGFNGLIDDVRIYNYARTPDEIALDYNAGFAARFGSQSSCDDDPGSCMDYGLVGYWNFDEGGGTYAYDDSDYSNTGTLGGYAGATSSDPKWASGKVGGGLSFDGKDDYVDTGNGTSLDVTQTLTLEAWVKRSVAGVRGMIMSKWSDAGRSYRMEFQADNTIYIDVSQDAAAVTRRIYTTDSAFSSTGWYHIVATANAGADDYHIYVNGSETAGTKSWNAISSIYVSTANFAVGKELVAATPAPFNGLIDEVRLYNRALSAEEVRYHYNRGGPVAHWTFDEGNGTTTYDSTNNGNDGYFASTTTSPSWTTGKYGSALSFDGSNNYVEVADSDSLDIASAITISAWVEIGATRPAVAGYIAGKHGAGSPGSGWSFWHYNSVDNKFYFQAGNGVVAWPKWDISTLSGYSAEGWYHVVAVNDGSYMNIYVNGVLATTPLASGSIGANTVNLWIGRSVASNNYTWGGKIDDVRIYNYARTPSQIQQDYNQGMAAHFGPVGEGVATKDCNNDPAGCMDYGLVGYWGFEEGNGTTTYDGSDYLNDGQFVTAASSPKWTMGISPLSGGVSGGGALQFDGKDDYVSAGNDTSLQLTDAITFEVWLKPSKLQDIRIIGKAVYAAAWQGWNLVISNNDPRIYWGDGSTEDNLFAGSDAPVSEWTHVAFTYQSTGSENVKIYVNGSEANSKTSAQALADSGTNLVLSNVAGGGYYAGLFDDVRIYNRVLSAEEVRYHYNRGGPVAHWKFDEGYGTTTYDESANDNDGTFVTSASSPTWVQGKYGSALSFDGTDDYVTVANSSSTDITAAITVEAWVNPNSDASGNTEGYVIKGSSTANGQYGFQLSKSTSNQLRVLMEDSSNNEIAIIGGTISKGSWTHITVTFQANDARIYINGIQVGSNTSLANLKSVTGALRIGMYSNNNYYSGLIDDVRIYNYARTPGQIIQDYNAGLSTHFK